MVTGLFLYIKGKIQERFRQADNLEFKVQNIQLLSELRDKLAKTITLNVSANDLNEGFINKVNEIITQNPDVQPRNCLLQFKVYDADENITVIMPSKKIKVNPNNDLLTLLELNHLEFKLN